MNQNDVRLSIASALAGSVTPNLRRVNAILLPKELKMHFYYEQFDDWDDDEANCVDTEILCKFEDCAAVNTQVVVWGQRTLPEAGLLVYQRYEPLTAVDTSCPIKIPKDRPVFYRRTIACHAAMLGLVASTLRTVFWVDLSDKTQLVFVYDKAQALEYDLAQKVKARAEQMLEEHIELVVLVIPQPCRLRPCGTLQTLFARKESWQGYPTHRQSHELFL